MENTMVNISVVSNSALGIASHIFPVEYQGDPEKFHDDVVMASAAAGYPSVLGYKGDWEMIMSVRNYKELFETLLQKEQRIQQIEPLKEALLEIRDAHATSCTSLEEEQNRVVEKWVKKGVTLTYENDCWWANEYWNRDSIHNELTQIYSHFDTTRDVLKMMGLDPEGEAKKKQACTNLGLYRVA